MDYPAGFATGNLAGGLIYMIAGGIAVAKIQKRFPLFFFLEFRVIDVVPAAS